MNPIEMAFSKLKTLLPPSAPATNCGTASANCSTASPQTNAPTTSAPPDTPSHSENALVLVAQASLLESPLRPREQTDVGPAFTFSSAPKDGVSRRTLAGWV
jgi:hypothetical protein